MAAFDGDFPNAFKGQSTLRRALLDAPLKPGRMSIRRSGLNCLDPRDRLFSGLPPGQGASGPPAPLERPAALFFLGFVPHYPVTARIIPGLQDHLSPYIVHSHAPCNRRLPGVWLRRSVASPPLLHEYVPWDSENL